MTSKLLVISAAVALAVGAAVAPLSPIAAGAAVDSCRTIPADADPVLKSDVARDEFGVDGRGIKVGIVSDSYNVVPTLSTASENVADGLLPGAGNPCGYRQEVLVLSDFPVPTPSGVDAPTDEGRAMAQMVHGIAPGAELLFASAGPGFSDTQAAIDLLAAQGVDVIVDDVILDGEPFYQQSLISTRIEELVAQGITYLSAAGNNSAPAISPKLDQQRTPISGWETAAYRPALCDPTVPVPAILPAGYTGYDCLDFDPTDGVSTVSNILTLPMELPLLPDGVTAQLPLIMQWGEPFGSAEAKFEMIVTTNKPDPTTLDEVETGDPVRFAEVPFDVTGLLDPNDFVDDEVNMQISIVRYTDGTANTEITPPIGFSSTADGSPWAVNADWWQSQGPDTVGRTIIGHNGAPAAITVAATGAFSGERVEYFSSIGPVTYYLTPQRADGLGTVLPAPQIVHKPNILSVDGARQNVINGGEPLVPQPGVFLFNGTSAATPTAGGVVALALQLDPELSPAAVAALLAQTATPIAAPYPPVPAADSVGAGLINAQALLSAISAELPAPAPNAPQRPALAASGGGGALGLALGGGALLVAGASVLLTRRRPEQQS